MKLKIVGAATAATLVLGVFVGATVSPTFAEYIKSFFDRPTLDTGLQTAAKQGFSQETQAAVTDQGITFKVKEVLADSNRLIFTYSIEDVNGKPIDPVNIFEKVVWNKYENYFIKGNDAFYITDDEGNVVSISTNYQTAKGRIVTQSIRQVLPHPPYADLTFRLKEDLKSKNLYVNIDVHEINSIKGRWKLKVPVDLEKSLAATKTVPLNEQYITPEGLRIELQNIVFSPTATSFDIKSEWTEEGKEKMKDHPEFFLPQSKSYSYHGLRYQIVDELGNVVGTNHPLSKEQEKRIPVSTRADEDMENGEKTVWHHSFAPFKESKSLYFVLNGVVRTEYPFKEMVIEPKTLEDNPVTMEYKGNSYTFKKFTVDKKTNTAVLEIDQIVTEMGGDFQLTDTTGKIYRLDHIASKGEWEPVNGKKDFFKLRYKAIFKDFKEVPQKLKVTLLTAAVVYDDVNWKVELPKKSQ